MLKCIAQASVQCLKNGGAYFAAAITYGRYIFMKSAKRINVVKLFFSNKLECFSRQTFSEQSNICEYGYSGAP